MLVTNENEKTLFREAGRRLGELFDLVCERAVVGTSTKEIDDFAREHITSLGDTPAFLNYTPGGAPRPYPATVCASVNEEVVHGIPNEDARMLADGDIVTFDIGLIHEGVVVDAARTVGIGTVDEPGEKLIAAAREALSAALKAARVGNTTGDIGHAVEEVARRYGFTTPHELGGHGVGRHVHEAPFIPNFGTPGKGDVLKEGMVLAIEPIVIEGNSAIRLLPDGYTYVTKDGSRSAQFEQTVIVTEKDPIVVTRSS